MTTRIVADSAFGCAGQRCLAASLAVTVGEAGKTFTNAIAQAASSRIVSYGLEPGVQMGPVITAESKSRIKHLWFYSSLCLIGFPVPRPFKDEAIRKFRNQLSWYRKPLRSSNGDIECGSIACTLSLFCHFLRGKFWNPYTVGVVYFASPKMTKERISRCSKVFSFFSHQNDRRGLSLFCHFFRGKFWNPYTVGVVYFASPKMTKERISRCSKAFSFFSHQNDRRGLSLFCYYGEKINGKETWESKFWVWLRHADKQ
jgi:hypothetical protein